MIKRLGVELRNRNFKQSNRWRNGISPI